MPSPFPGMNPYLEHPHLWEDFSRTFLVNLRSSLVRQVVPKYFVRIAERLYAASEEESAVHVVRSRPTRSVAPARVPAPATVIVPWFPTLKVVHLEVMEDRSREPVTVINLLHPTWKGVQNRRQYLDDRRALFASQSNLVEIDLLRDGERMPWGNAPPAHEYSVAVCPKRERPHVGFWPIQLRDALPTIPIPLGADDAPARIDLQAVLHTAYDSAGYAIHVYHSPPHPPLPPPDDAWAADLARAATPT